MELTTETAKMFVSNYEKFNGIFGDVLADCLKKYTVENFSTFKYVPIGGYEDNHFQKCGYPVLCDRTTWEFEEYRGEWMRKVRKPAREYRVPESYQLHESKLLRDCLIAKFPYLSEFQFDCYKLDMKDPEIYIKCEDKLSLYVPIEALAKNDFSIIENRVRTYWERYYNSPDRKEYLNKQLGTLTSEIGLRLADILNAEVK